jgi:NAD+ kinase
MPLSFPPPPRLAFLAAPENRLATASLKRLCTYFPNYPVQEADFLIALGGDGFMLATLHQYLALAKPVFGLNRGTVGFLMNGWHEDFTDLPERLKKARAICLQPLKMRAKRRDGSIVEGLAINEVSLLRQTSQAAKLAIAVDGVIRLDSLICDGILVATPAGSTAYNFSAHGPIIPLTAGILALTPISAFRPRRWRGALLSQLADIRLIVKDPQKRPVAAVADTMEVRDVLEVCVHQATTPGPILLFDAEHDLEERILKEQFTP